MGRIGSGQVVLKYRGSGRVGSGRVGSGRFGSGQEVLKSNGSGRVGSQEVLKSRGSDRVGSRGFEVSRVGSGRVKKFGKSCEMLRVGSGHDPRGTVHWRTRPPLPTRGEGRKVERHAQETEVWVWPSSY